MSCNTTGNLKLSCNTTLLASLASTVTISVLRGFVFKMSCNTTFFGVSACFRALPCCTGFFTPNVVWHDIGRWPVFPSRACFDSRLLIWSLFFISFQFGTILFAIEFLQASSAQLTFCECNQLKLNQI